VANILCEEKKEPTWDHNKYKINVTDPNPNLTKILYKMGHGYMKGMTFISSGFS
jgi:hypothetical protein